MGDVLELPLRREGMGFQPVQKPGAIGRDDVALGVVDMGIHKPGDQEGVPVVQDVRVRRKRPAEDVEWSRIRHEAVLDQ